MQYHATIMPLCNVSMNRPYYLVGCAFQVHFCGLIILFIDEDMLYYSVIKQKISFRLERIFNETLIYPKRLDIFCFE